MELINRNDLEELFWNQINLGASPKDAFEDALQDCPGVDAVPVVHGRWIDEGAYVTAAYGSLDVYQCSNCNQEITIDDYDNYCPNCGARMDGDAK